MNREVHVRIWERPEVRVLRGDSTIRTFEFFGLDDVMPGNLNERVPRDHPESRTCATER